MRKLLEALASLFVAAMDAIAIIVVVGLLVIMVALWCQKPQPYASFLDYSCSVVTSEGEGSGVLVKRPGHLFCLTNAHVLTNGKKDTKAWDAAKGQFVLHTTFEDISLLQNTICGGRKTGYKVAFAKVIRYSDMEDGGDDLAVLLVHDTNFVKSGASFPPKAHIPAVGDEVCAVSSPNGHNFNNHATFGKVSSVGDLRHQAKVSCLNNPKVFDCLNLTARFGSSGSGVFSRGKCVGLISQMMCYTGREAETNFTIMIPVRRIYEFCERADCMWVLDHSLPVPHIDIIMRNVVQDFAEDKDGCEMPPAD
jgi:hypothetical protein